MTHNRLSEMLNGTGVLIMDGAMGTELARRGLLFERERADEWSLSHPEEVLAVHRAYLDAGAECLLTNTFLAHQEPDRRRRTEIVRAGLRLARKAGDGSQLVLGSIGPSTPNEQDHVLHVAQELEDADGLLLETQTSLAAVERVLSEIGASVRLLLSFAFTGGDSGLVLRGPDGDFTVDDVVRFVERSAHRLCAVGLNCGRDVNAAAMLLVVRRFRTVTGLPVLTRPNAGIGLPAAWAEGILPVIGAGACLIGGCCGATPEHIAACRRAVSGLTFGRTAPIGS
jgi:5-methyltetrahydrofolate--homocysteine methyltransferase